MIINQTVSGGSAPTPTKKYQLLDRVVDDNNAEIGTISGFFYDSNNTEYAVVCLDKKYRSYANVEFLSDTQYVTGFPTSESSSVWDCKYTATQNCDLVITFANDNNLTCSGITNCRQSSFTIDNVIYYGQAPNINELADIFTIRSYLNTNDSTSGAPIDITKNYMTSCQYDRYHVYVLSSNGTIVAMTKTIASQSYYQYRVLPILEIPNAI